MTHNGNIQTSDVISKHLKIEEEPIRVYTSPTMAFVAKGCRPKSNRPYCGKKPKKGPYLSQNSQTKGGFGKKHKAKGTGDMDMTFVKYYNCGKKEHFAWDCLEPTKVLLSTSTSELYVCSHAFVVNCLPQCMTDT